jgi:hypothetical protein
MKICEIEMKYHEKETFQFYISTKKPTKIPTPKIIKQKIIKFPDISFARILITFYVPYTT